MSTISRKQSTHFASKNCQTVIMAEVSCNNIDIHVDSDWPLHTTTPFDFDYDSDCPDSLTDFNFVTNLFQSHQDYLPIHDGPHQNPIFNPFSQPGRDNFGFRIGGSDLDDGDLGFGDEFDRVDSSFNGLRVVGIDSDSDTEEEDVTNGAHPVDWEESVVFDGHEECEWEQVDNDDREGGSGSVIDRVEEEITVSSSEISSVHEEDDDDVIIGGETVRNLEWEILLAVNNFTRDIELENNGDGVTFLDVEEEGYMFGTEYHDLFEQFVERESGFKGRPPAAKSVVENLPSVVLTKEYVQENNVVCAVCKDGIGVEDRATLLPCNHHYHGECIVPWLNIRNTCPVCRFELPTDDADYERRKEGGDGLLGLLDDLQVRYNLELLP